MKFSIISAVYNVEKYISETIESVINQTYSDWELILIDDGSTDASGRICDEYAQKDSRIIVVHTENQGAYKARLLGNEYITGDYVIGLDSDDTYEKNLLAEVDKAVSEFETDVVIFGLIKKYSSGETINLPFFYEIGKPFLRDELLNRAILARDHSLCDKAVRSEIYKNTKYIEEEYRLCVNLDYMQSFPLLCAAESAVAIDKNLYNYRIHDESISHRVCKDHIVDTDWLHSRFLDYLKERNLLTEEIKLSLLKTYCQIVYPRLKRLIKEKTFFALMFSKMKSLEFMGLVSENVKLLNINKKERVLYKYASKGHLFWGVFLSKVL